jgi:DNA polymerase-3 subunit alpha
MDAILEFHKKTVKDNANQGSLFDMSSTMPFTLKPAPPATQEERLGWEKELLGLFVSGFPLDPWKEKILARGIDIDEVHHTVPDGKEVSLAVIIEHIKVTTTKKGDKMGLVTLRDYRGSIEVAVFPETYKRYKDKLVMDTPIVVRGKVSTRNGEKTIVIDEVKLLTR